MAKSQTAFRTISEVSAKLDTPTHVLRFWESKFTQIKPVKRAGGRRYYRPEDIQLLSGIKTLLHDQGMTIKGAQKLLREQGVKHVMSMTDSLDEAPAATVAASPDPVDAPAAVITPEATAPQSDPVVAPLVPAPDNIVAMPAPKPQRPSIIACLPAADRAKLHANAAQIAPLLTQLADLRDSIRATM